MKAPRTEDPATTIQVQIGMTVLAAGAATPFIAAADRQPSSTGGSTATASATTRIMSNPSSRRACGAKRGRPRANAADTPASAAGMSIAGTRGRPCTRRRATQLAHRTPPTTAVQMTERGANRRSATAPAATVPTNDASGSRSEPKSTSTPMNVTRSAAILCQRSAASAARTTTPSAQSIHRP